MNVINIKNGILLDYTNNYSIYEMYTADAKAYYMCIANFETDKFEMVVDFPEEYFNSLLKDDKITEIKNTCNTLYADNHPYLYILPNVTTYDLKDSQVTNDNHAYQVLLRKLQKYTYDVYKNITENNSNIMIDEKINLIIDTLDDRKFLDFLEINLNNYFVPMSLDRSIQNEHAVSEDVPIIIKEDVKEDALGVSKKRVLKNDNDFGYTNIAFIAVGIVIGIITFIYLFLYK